MGVAWGALGVTWGALGVTWGRLGVAWESLGVDSPPLNPSEFLNGVTWGWFGGDLGVTWV